MKFDQHYTPEWLAARMVAKVRSPEVRSIADFAAGDGALLSCAEAEWPNARKIAADLDPAIVARLKVRHPDWLVSQCDFLSYRSRRMAAKHRSWDDGVDLVLLNPPFSCRGGSRVLVSIGKESVTCSRALAFVATALPYVSDDGEVVALMPINTLSSEKDATAWELIRKQYRISKGEISKRRDFSGCFVRCVVLRMSRGRNRRLGSRPQDFIDSKGRKPRIKLIRGTVQMHLAGVGSRTLVHSTDLLSNSVILNGHVAPTDRPSIVGPAVLVPRVGLPSKEKICIYLRRKRVVLSDCVIGLQCNTGAEAIMIHRRLLSKWNKLSRIYTGTCARYTTLQRLGNLLTTLGCIVETKIEM